MFPPASACPASAEADRFNPAHLTGLFQYSRCPCFSVSASKQLMMFVPLHFKKMLSREPSGPVAMAVFDGFRSMIGCSQERLLAHQDGHDGPNLVNREDSSQILPAKGWSITQLLQAPSVSARAMIRERNTVGLRWLAGTLTLRPLGDGYSEGLKRLVECETLDWASIVEDGCTYGPPHMIYLFARMASADESIEQQSWGDIVSSAGDILTPSMGQFVSVEFGTESDSFLQHCDAILESEEFFDQHNWSSTSVR